MPALIGVIGRKRAGKDAFADALVRGHDYTRVAFADALKDACLRLDPVLPIGGGQHRRVSTLVAERGWEDAKELPAVRRLLQDFGVTIRSLRPTLWLEVAFERISRSDGPIVIPDVRFTNEADAIEARGGLLVRLIRSGIDTTDTHISETQLETRQPAYVVHNAGTLRDLAIAAAMVATAARLTHYV